jgi:hypothetical protein
MGSNRGGPTPRATLEDVIAAIIEDSEKKAHVMNLRFDVSRSASISL